MGRGNGRGGIAKALSGDAATSASLWMVDGDYFDLQPFFEAHPGDLTIRSRLAPLLQCTVIRTLIHC